MLLLFILITFCCARPERPPLKDGEIRNIKGKKHFTYNSNDNLKRSSRRTFDYKYDIELKDGFHSLDDEEYIEDVKCYEDHLEILSTTKEPIGWKEGDTLSGSEMWKCETGITKKIEYVDYEGVENGFHKFFVKTESAGLRDIFANADVKFENHVSVKEMLEKEERKRSERLDKQEVNATLKESTVKAGRVVTRLSPKDGDLMDSKHGFPVDIRITGCTSPECANMWIHIHIMIDDWASDTELDYFDISFQCGLSGECGFNQIIMPKAYGDNQDQIYFKIALFDGNSNKFWEEKTGKFRINYHFINFLNPRPGEVVPFNKPYQICWEGSDRIKYPVKIEMWQDDDIIEPDPGFYIETNKGCKEVTFNPSNYQNNENYYMYVKINGIESQSATFVLGSNKGDYGVEILMPVGRKSYQTGDPMNIKWEPGDYTGSITLKVVREVKFWVDEVVWSETVPAAKRERPIEVQPWAAGNYYVELEYDCGFLFCSNLYSETFSYNKIYKFEDVVSSVDEENKKVTVSYKSKYNVGNHYITIKQHLPSISPFDLEIKGVQQQSRPSMSAGESKTIELSYITGSIFDCYVEISYNCIFGDFWCDTETHEITQTIPYTTALGFNYDFNQNGAREEEIEIFKLRCEDNTEENENENKEEKNANDEGSKMMKKLCDQFPEGSQKYFELSTVCEGCYFAIPLTLKNFELQMDLFDVHKFRLDVEIGVEYYIRLVTTFKGEFQWVYEQPIRNPGFLQPNPFSFSIGPVSLTFGPSLGFIFKTEFDATVMLQIIATYGRKQTVTMTLDSKAGQLCTLNSAEEFDNPDNGIEFYGSAHLTIIPQIVATIGFKFSFNDFTVVHTEANLAFGIQFDIGFRFPPFEPDPDYGMSNPHFIRYEQKLFVNAQAYYEFWDHKIEGTFPKEEPLELFSTTRKLGWLQIDSGAKRLSFSLNIKQALLKRDVAVLGYDIGEITKEKIDSKFNPYDVSVTKDESLGQYVIQFMSDTITEAAVEEIQDYVEEKLMLDEDDKSYLYSLKDKLSPCKLPNCKKCDLSGQKCRICDDEYILNDGYCINEEELCIPPKVNINGDCVDCPQPTVYKDGDCVQCNAPTIYQNGKCAECPAPSVYSNGACISCSSGSVYDYSSKQCKTCSAPNVITNGKCVSCDFGFAYSNGQCVSCEAPNIIEKGYCKACPSGTGYNNGYCDSCDSGHINSQGFCVYCDYGQVWEDDECKDCSAGTGYLYGECVTCPAGYFLRNNFCVYCTGIIVGDQCVICSDNYQVVNSDGTGCVNCPSPLGFYKPTISCVNCTSYSMITKNGVCEYCEGNTFFKNGECVECPTDSVYDSSFGGCVCNGETSFYNEEENKCINCDELGLEFDSIVKICECPGEQAFNGTKCIDCSQFGLRKINGECQCGEQDYKNGDKCYSCESDLNGVSIEDSGSYHCVCPNGAQMYRKSGDLFAKCYSCSELWGGEYNERFGECKCPSGQHTFYYLGSDLPTCISCDSRPGFVWDESSYGCVCETGLTFLWTEFDKEIPICGKCEDYGAIYDENYLTCRCPPGTLSGPTSPENPFNCIPCESMNSYYDDYYETCVCYYGYEWKTGKFDNYPKCHNCYEMGADFDYYSMSCVCPKGYEMLNGDDLSNLPHCVSCESWGGKWNDDLGRCVCEDGYEKYERWGYDYPKCVKCSSFGATFNEITKTCNCPDGKFKDNIGNTPVCRTCTEMNGVWYEEYNGCYCLTNTEPTSNNQLKCMSCEEKGAVWDDYWYVCKCPEGTTMNQYLNKCGKCEDYGMKTKWSDGESTCECDGILNKETFYCDPIPDTCQDDVERSGYLLYMEDTTFSLYEHRIGTCYSVDDNEYVKEIVSSSGNLMSCYYNTITGFKGCYFEDHAKFITNSKDMPEHGMWKSEGYGKYCTYDNKYGLIGKPNQCIDEGYGYYSKYTIENGKLTLGYYWDEDCLNVAEYDQEIYDCDICTVDEDTYEYYDYSEDDYVNKTSYYSVYVSCSPLSFNFDPEPEPEPEPEQPNPNEPGDGEENNPDQTCQIEYSNNKLIVKGCESVCQNNVDEYKQATTIEIGDGVQKIKEKAFEGFTNVETIIIGKDVKEIGENAFQDCSGQTQIQYNGEAITCGESVFGNKVNRVVVTSSYKGTTICGKQAIKDDNPQQPGAGNDGASSFNVLFVMIIFLIMI